MEVCLSLYGCCASLLMSLVCVYHLCLSVSLVVDCHVCQLFCEVAVVAIAVVTVAVVVVVTVVVVVVVVVESLILH